MFKLNIGTVTRTVAELDKKLNRMVEIRGSLNNNATELTELGWSGASRDKYIEYHQRNMQKYRQLEEQLKYMKSILENDLKPKAVQLKKRSEDFVNYIKRTGTSGSLTSDDEGIIVLEGNQYSINNNVINCTSNYHPKMQRGFQEIMDLVGRLEYTSFNIGNDIWNAQTSIRNQTTSLTDFDDSFNIYCNDVRQLESNMCTLLGKTSQVSTGVSGSGSYVASKEEAEELRKLLIKKGLIKDYLQTGATSDEAVIKPATNDSIPLVSDKLIIDKYNPYMKVIKDGMYVQNYAQDGRYYLGTVTYDSYTGLARFHAIDKEAFDNVSSCFTKNYWTSVGKAGLAGGIKFSQSINEANNSIGELFIDFDTCPVGSDKTYREIAEKDRQRYIEDLNKLREEAPYKRTFDEDSEITNDALNAAGLATGARELVNIGKTGVNYVKAAAPEIKSIFSGNGLASIEDVTGKTKIITCNSMEFVGDISQEVGKARLNAYGDAIRDSLGPARLSHPEEYNDILNHAKEIGAGVEFRPGTLAYDMEFGKPGRLIIDPDASIGAMRHEYTHMLDDLAAGHPGMRIIIDSEAFWRFEYRGYMQEIKLARETRDYNAGKFIIDEMRARRQEILGK